MHKVKSNINMCTVVSFNKSDVWITISPNDRGPETLCLEFLPCLTFYILDIYLLKV